MRYWRPTIDVRRNSRWSDESAWADKTTDA